MGLKLSWLKDIPIWDWIIPEGGCLDMDAVPDCWERNAHLERYAFACKVFQGGTVLDFGCGIGYGSEMLVQAGNQVTACDVSETALAKARERRGSCGAVFVKPSDGAARRNFDGVVAFEVLEHLDEPGAFIDDMAARSKHLVISTPIVPSTANNPHHRHDFTAEQFRAMIERHFTIRCEWVQIRPWRNFPSYMILHGARA
jgi:2-polyprenyl-3-methyl-5-hydroxy-6-metoxy-1,4-benzoquinol methylase